MSIHLVHCSDIHLDRNFNFGEPLKSVERRKDVENNFVKTVDFAIKERTDLFLISGDIFDRFNPSNTARSFFTIQIKKLKDKNIEVVMIAGNHEVPKFGATALAVDSLQSAGLATVFSATKIFQEKTFNFNNESVHLVGKSYNVKNQNLNPFDNFNIKKKGKYQICLIHGSLVGANITPTNPHVTLYHPFGINDVDSSINYLALGHFHNYFKRKTNTTICNPGSIEKLNWSEVNDQKGFAFVELNSEGENVDFIPLESRKFKLIEITLDNKIKNINDYILDKIVKVQNKEEILKVKISGRISKDQQNTFFRSKLVLKSADFFFHIDFDYDLEIEGLGKVFLGRIESPIQAFEKHLNDLLEKSTEQNEQFFLNKAKQRGFEYLGHVI